MLLERSAALIGLLLALPGAARASATQAETTPPQEAAFSADDVVQKAMAENPAVKSAQEQYQAAVHQIDQAYTPQDPQASWSADNSPTGFNHPTANTVGISESFQFPGEAWLQGDVAHRTAEIARLTYMAAARDARAQALTTFYQTQLDSASITIGQENTASIAQVLHVVEVAYSASQAAQSDLITAEISLTQSSQTVWTSQVAAANDEASLNQLIGREPQTPIEITGELQLEPLLMPLEEMKTKAMALRQEILEAALTEKNAKTAVTLAEMEYLPNFNVSYSRNRYILPSAPPDGDNTITPSDNTISVGINVPIFFWWHQKEDVRSAEHLLESARQNRRGVELQTLTAVVQLYRSTMLAYKVAELNKDLLIPLATQDFRVALVAYQSKKVDFLTLSSALQGIYNARINYLAAANQYLAGRVALEQAIGAPLK
jgi:cobalt-zinc-cadmium efflux system outer membrane protein